MSCAFLRLNKYDTHARAVRETQIRGSPQSAHMTRAVERPARTNDAGTRDSNATRTREHQPDG